MAGHLDPIGPFPEGVDEADYDRLRRRVLWALPTGLYLLGASDGSARNLMTCNLVAQVSMQPKLVGVSVENESFTKGLIDASAHCCLSLLKQSDRVIVRKFVKPASDDRSNMTLNETSYVDARTSGAPIYAGAYAFLDLHVDRSIAFISHTLFIAEVIDAGFLGDENDAVLSMSDTKMSYGG